MKKPNHKRFCYNCGEESSATILERGLAHRCNICDTIHNYPKKASYIEIICHPKSPRKHE